MKGCLQVQSVLLEKSGKVGLQLSFKLATFFLRERRKTNADSQHFLMCNTGNNVRGYRCRQSARFLSHIHARQCFGQITFCGRFSDETWRVVVGSKRSLPRQRMWQLLKLSNIRSFLLVSEGLMCTPCRETGWHELRIVSVCTRFSLQQRCHSYSEG